MYLYGNGQPVLTSRERADTVEGDNTQLRERIQKAENDKLQLQEELEVLRRQVTELQKG